MPASDYMPQKDGDLVPWSENFIAVATTNTAILGIVAGDLTALTTKTTFVPNFSNPAGPTFFRVKAQKGDLISEAANVVGV